MNDLGDQLGHCLHGRACLMALGNTDYGDDGFGVCLGEELLRLGVPEVIIAGAEPDRYISRVVDGRFDHLVFLDAVEFGAAPGSVILLNAHQIFARYPQISTHKISLGVLAKWVEANGRTKVWLLGAQPESVKPGQALSAPVQATLDVLCELLLEVAIGTKHGETAAPGRPVERSSTAQPEEVTVC
jgi:hydrogenase maturation protease